MSNAFPPNFIDAIVDLLGFFLQLYGSDFLHEFGEFHRLIDADAEGDAVCQLHQFCQMLISDNLVILVSTENGILAAEAIEAAAENALIEEFVLAEKVQRAVGDRCAGQDEVVSAVLTEPV